MTTEELWQTVLAQIQFSVSRANFATWLKNTKILSKKDGEVIILVENSFTKEWLDKKYSSLILKILRSIDSEIKTISFLINDFKKQPSLKSKTLTTLENKESLTSSPLLELEIDSKTNLNPRYTFENFIVGGFNQMAQAAAYAVSEKPGALYNPLFIYAGVGLGKTHLLQACGNRLKEIFPEKKIKYIPCEKFISDIITSIIEQKIDAFKKEFNNIDILIADDVQFFTGKEKSQEQFFYIFNLLQQSQKQIILSSDASPKGISGLEERLRSRFEGGMIVDIGTPDLETRIAILKKKMEEKNIEIKKEILEYISLNIRNNIRELEGALNKIIFFKKIHNKFPDLETTKQLLKSLFNHPKKKTNFKKITKTICEFYDLKEEELLSTTRRKEVVKPRQIIMYLLREELNESFPSIGRKFKGKDHTTVMYAWSKIDKEIKENEELLSEINLIRQKLYLS